MALNKKHTPELEALILRGAAEVKQLNPHIGHRLPPYSDEEYASILRDGEEIEQLWNTSEGQRAQKRPGEPAAEAVDEDRGE
ncbi:MAG: hypothetical protein OJF49_003940 [Ktedonobacterales bacterium]|jgi:hypothetical protein|nr:MAG: hypothetical protein OJF49_003940 [Ktedonobacterales bacterium]